MTPGVCCLPHSKDPDRPRGTVQGLLVCQGHVDKILGQLDAIGDLLGQVPWDLDPVKGGTDGRSSKGAAPPVPIRLDVLAIRDGRNSAVVEPGDVPDVHGVLESWAMQVTEQRPAAYRGTALSVLRVNHDWVCAQEWIIDYVTELREVERALRAVTGEERPRPVGRCPRFVGTGKNIRECGGAIWPILDGEGKPTDAVGCGSCGEVRSGLDRLRLKLMMEAG